MNIKQEQSPMRVLQIGFNLGIGGIENFIINYYRNIDKKQIQFDFILFQKDGIYRNELEEMGARLYYCNRSGGKLCQEIQSILQIGKILRKNHYCVVHVHSCSFFGLLAGILPAKLHRVKHIIAHGHNPGIPKNNLVDNAVRWFMKQTVTKLANIYFACSREVAASKYSRSIIMSNRYLIINNAIDIEKFRYDERSRKNFRDSLGINNCLVIGSVSRMETQKNHNFMLEIFAEVHKRNQETVLLLAGTGTLEDQLKEKAKCLGIQNNVIFYGEVKEPAPIYQAIDIYISTSFYEGLGISLIEAQASGCVCVTAPVPEETNATGDLIIIPLQESIDVWTQKILNIKIHDRHSNIQKVESAGFDIHVEAKKLQKYYLELDD